MYHLNRSGKCKANWQIGNLLYAWSRYREDAELRKKRAVTQAAEQMRTAFTQYQVD